MPVWVSWQSFVVIIPFMPTERGLQDSVSEEPAAHMDISIVKTPTREEGRGRDGTCRSKLTGSVFLLQLHA